MFPQGAKSITGTRGYANCFTWNKDVRIAETGDHPVHCSLHPCASKLRGRHSNVPRGTNFGRKRRRVRLPPCCLFKNGQSEDKSRYQLFGEYGIMRIAMFVRALCSSYERKVATRPQLGLFHVEQSRRGYYRKGGSGLQRPSDENETSLRIRQTGRRLPRPSGRRCDPGRVLLPDPQHSMPAIL